MESTLTTEGARSPHGSARLGHVVALDGLRGLAVALVVVYHFAPQVLPAGFLGVDVFFVLSGFLITSLALAEHDRTGTFRAGAFVGRRVRRLLPAAVTAVVAITLAAVLLQADADRQPLRGDALASLLYGANWWSIAQGDSYQSSFGAESPFNHFWSLAVEEQFYVLFPLVVLGLAVVLARRGGDRRALARWLLVGSVLLMAASARLMAVLHDPYADPSRAYLGSDTRAHAVLAGVAAACAVHLWRDHLARPTPRRALLVAAATGAVVVLWASRVAGFRADWLYGGGFLLVALGTAALTAALATGVGPWLSRPFEARALCTLGLYSYGIYLWHWPVRVFVDGDRTGLSGVALFAVRIALTAVLTVASARLVEARFRRRRADGRPEVTTPTLALLAVGGVAVTAWFVWTVAAPVARPAGADQVAVAPTVAAPGPTAPSEPEAATPPGALVPASGPITIMWEGDSVAWTMAGGDFGFPQPDTYTSPFDDSRVVVWNRAKYMCPLLPVVSRTMAGPRDGNACDHRQRDWAEGLEAFHPEVVAWSGGLRDTADVLVDGEWLTFASPEWDEAYLEGLADLRRMATSQGAALLLVGQLDGLADTGEQVEDSLLPDGTWRWGHLRDLQRGFAEEHAADTRFVDLQAALCPAGGCPTRTPAGDEFFLDGAHWSGPAVTASAPAITDAIEAALGRTPAPPT